MKWNINNAIEMQHHGFEFAKRYQHSCMIALIGNLGVGKTLWATGFIKGLGSAQQVVSPTFSYLTEYHDTLLPVFHFDFYRIANLNELMRLSWYDYVDANGIILVEWADLFPALFDENTIFLKFSMQGNHRLIEHISIEQLD
jgi:tRNA threonylcarbamoyladenosine biosynthesis protein TsaE